MTVITQASLPSDRRLPQPDLLDPARDALFLDLDGTLAHIRPRPDEVRVDPEMLDLLGEAAERLHGRVAVVSGRELGALDRLLCGRVACLSGVHGLERRDPAGAVVRAEASPGHDAVVAAARDLAAARPGLLVEDKGLSVALHYRAVPAARAEVETLMRRLAQTHGLALQAGHMVVELRTPGPDKGGAVRAFMAEPPFAGFRPIFVGDDLTDEHAFAAAAELGGCGVLVGPPRDTAAARRLDDVAAVHDWIRRSLQESRP